MNQLYRVIFKGEVFPGYDLQPVMQNVKLLCRYDDATINMLFSGRTCIIKDRIDHHQAKQYKSALEQTGIICHIEAFRPN